MKVLRIVAAAVSLAAVATLGFAHDVEAEIRFEVAFGDTVASCGYTYGGVGAEGSTVTLQDLRFFVSNLRLLTADGAEVPLNVVDDGVWQHDGIVLLDFEDGSGACDRAGNAALNTTVTAIVDNHLDYRGLAFDVGVPFGWNHVDSATAPSPLNLTPMFWSWRGGYKFMRVELLSLDGDEPVFWPLHVGSTGCESPAAVIAPEEPCTNPNVQQIVLEGFDPLRDSVVVDLSSMYAGVDVSRSLELAPPGCMSGVLDPDCSVLFANLGIDMASGDAVAASALFRAGPVQLGEPSFEYVAHGVAQHDEKNGQH